MKTTLDIPEKLLEEAVLLAGTRTKTQAITIALKEFIRRQKLERIIRESGHLRFSDDWEGACHDRQGPG